MSEIAVKVSHVQKEFKLPTEATKSLRTMAVNYVKGIKGYKKQEVLHDISFEVEKGDFFGIVGRNGSGKSTLLKIISQIYVPEAGQVTVNGSLSSFIELGVGFNEELTGRENVYLNGAMLGFSTQEVDKMYEQIVNFAELGEFMDQKLKNYSSGMQVRLSFAIAIQSHSDVLILDEVLAVGDEAFQRKCRDYFKQVRAEGKTVVLVTHDMNAVREYCSKAMLIDKGNVVEISENVNRIAMQYSNLFIPEEHFGDDPLRMGNGKVIFTSHTHTLDAATYRMDCQVKNLDHKNYEESLDIGVNFYQGGRSVGGNHLFFQTNKGLSLKSGETKDLVIEFPNQFGQGEFTVDISIASDDGQTLNDMIRIANTFTNIYNEKSNASMVLPMTLKDKAEKV